MILSALKKKLFVFFVVGAAASVATYAAVAIIDAISYNATPQSFSSGTLKLTQTDNGAGFTTAVSGLVPGDVVNRYATYTNSGTLAGQALTVSAADGASTLLTGDATKGLALTVSSCSVAWTPASGVCGGTTTPLLASTSLLTLKTTPGSLVTGAVSAGAVYYLQFGFTLPAQTETTTNGTLPGGTIQGLTSTITLTLRETQRTATTLNS